MNTLDKVRQAKEVVEYDLEHVPRFLLHIFQERHRQLSAYEQMLSAGDHTDEKIALELAETCIRCDVRPPTKSSERSRRAIVRSKCLVCGRPIPEIRRANATYCSRSCRSKAARERQKQRETTQQARRDVGADAGLATRRRRG